MPQCSAPGVGSAWGSCLKFRNPQVEAIAPCAVDGREPNIGCMAHRHICEDTRRSTIMTELTIETPTTERLGTAPAGRVDAVNVSQHVGARQILQELSLSIEP